MMMKSQFFSSRVTLLWISLANMGGWWMVEAQQHGDWSPAQQNPSGHDPQLEDQFAAIRNTRVEPGNATITTKLIYETLRVGGIQAGIESDFMTQCFNEHVAEDEYFGVTNSWSLCSQGVVVDRQPDGLYLMDWRIPYDISNLYESDVLNSTMYVCYKDERPNWQLETEELSSCADAVVRPDWSLCRHKDSKSLEELCTTITENELIQISKRNESCAMWEAREIFQQFDRDFEQFLKSGCGIGIERRMTRRRHRARYLPIAFDRALYFQMAAGFPTDNFHLEYHGVKEISDWWNQSDYKEACRSCLEKQRYISLQNLLIYGRRNSTPDVARVKFRGTVTDPRFYASGQCYSATSNNQVVPACNQYGCIMSTSGTVALSVWCDLLPGTGLVSEKDSGIDWDYLE